MVELSVMVVNAFVPLPTTRPVSELAPVPPCATPKAFVNVSAWNAASPSASIEAMEVAVPVVCISKSFVFAPGALAGRKRIGLAVAAVKVLVPVESTSPPAPTGALISMF